jgi:hypothetical protein
MCVFMSPSANSARVSGQLSAKKVPELGLVLMLRSESEDMIFFTMDERCRFEYADALEGPEWLRETSKRNFEGVLALINSSGDRLYIYESK